MILSLQSIFINKDVYIQVYLKEILNEVCNYNLKNPHRNMWELKPEFRHYKDEKPASSKFNDSD